MKKRLLSAALALAMALTLLPMSVFAANGTATGSNNGEPVKYVDRDDDKNYTSGPGWYVTHTYKDSNNKSVTEYLKATTGVSVGGKYYTSLTGEALNADGNPKGTVIVIGTSDSLTVSKISSLNLDLYGSSGGITISSSDGKLTSLDVSNTRYDTGAAGTVTLSGLGSSLTNLKLDHVTINGIDLDPVNSTTVKPKTCTVTLTDVKVNGGISMNGASGDKENKDDARMSLSVTGGSIGGTVDVDGAGSTVTLKGVSMANHNINITGPGAKLTVNGGTNAGTGVITLTGNTTSDSTTVAKAAPAVDVLDRGTTVGNITGVAGEKCTSSVTYNIEGNTGTITLYNPATLNVRSGNTSDITLNKTSTVNISTNAANDRATVGDVNLNGASSTLKLPTGGGATVTDITVADPATTKVDVPKTEANTINSIGANYNQKTIQGGTWKTPVQKAALASGLVFQLKEGANYTYHTDDELGAAVVRQGGKAANELTVAGQTGTTYEVTFQNGDYAWGVLLANPDTHINKLPGEMNTVKTPQWTDGVNNPKAGEGYDTPNTSVAQNVVLNAGGGGTGTGDATKLVRATLVATGIAKDVTATLNGTVITLTGAVQGSTSFQLQLETDVVESGGSGTNQGSTGNDKPVVVTINVNYDADRGTLTFANMMDTDIDGQNHGVSRVDANTIKLRNGTTYTLNGSGLKVPASNIYVLDDADADRNGTTDSKTYPLDSTYTRIEVTVSAPGWTSTETLKEQVADVVNGSSSKFEWANSVVMRQSVNAALASITNDQVKQWVTEARRTAWTDNNSTGWKDANANRTNFDTCTVWLVPYLQVNVTQYSPSTTGANDASLTATLTPMYRVEVVPETSSQYAIRPEKHVGRVTDIGGANGPAYIVKTGTALTGISGDLTGGNTAASAGVKVILDPGPSGATYAHQDGTYVYPYSGGGRTIIVKHAGQNNGLGTFVLNNTKHTIALCEDKDATPKVVVARYDSLQAAVDDAKNGQYIQVESGYTGSTTINVTGYARTIYIQSNGKNVVVANATGGVVENNKDGNLYTIRLNRDMTGTPTTTSRVSVNKATGGTASVNNANPATGATVTITLSPSAGYTSNGVSVTDANGKAVTVSGSGNTYTFTMPSGNVTVTPSFKGGTTTTVNPTVTVSSSGNTGSATTSAGNKQVAPGSTVTVTTNPSTGYRTMGVLVNGSAVAATRTGTNTFSFTVPSNVTNVVVTPRFDVNNGTVFEDVWSTEYYSTPVAWAVSRGITNGESTYRFGSENVCTREDMVTFLYRAAGQPAVGNVTNPFWDVQPGSYYYNAVMWAVSKGITKGVSTNQFGVGQYVTRGQAVTFLYRYEGSPAASANSGFYDVNSREYYANAVSWASGKGVTNGTTTTTFSPDDYCKRCEIMTFMHRDMTNTRA